MKPWLDRDRTAAERAEALLTVMTPAQRVSLALGDFDAVASLGIPAISSVDGPSGVRDTGTTSLPSAQALSAAFDRGLARRYGEVVGEEARGRGFNPGQRPLFEFGHGLSYASFDVGRAHVSGRTAEVTVRNTSDRAGSTVVQLYGGDRPTLVGFEKVALDAGEARTLTIRLEERLEA